MVEADLFCFSQVGGAEFGVKSSGGVLLFTGEGLPDLRSDGEKISPDRSGLF